jgi:hypothetical protein
MKIDHCKVPVRCPICGEVIPAGQESVRSIVGIRFERLHPDCYLRARRERCNAGPIRLKRA